MMMHEVCSMVRPPVPGITARAVRRRRYGVIAVLLMLLRHISRLQRPGWSAVRMPHVARASVASPEQGAGDA
jgi:hypothetical protein